MGYSEASQLSSLACLTLRQCLKRSGVFAYPTEAVFGLGCDPWDGRAVANLLAIKQRSLEKGLIIIASALSQIEPLLVDLTEAQRAQLLESWPGPTTWSLPNRGFVPEFVTGGRSTVAVRLTQHPVAASIVNCIGRPIISTSANPSGREPARTPLKCRQYFGAQVPVITGALGGLKQPTRIKDLYTGQLLRR